MFQLLAADDGRPQVIRTDSGQLTPPLALQHVYNSSSTPIVSHNRGGARIDVLQTLEGRRIMRDRWEAEKRR